MERPKTSQKVIDLISQLVDSQDEKGMEKYGVTIDTASDYEWNVMALEEMVDGMKYMVKENEYLNKRLREFNKKTWFPVYEENLRLAEDVKKWHNHSVELSEQVYVLLKENEELSKAKNNAMEQNLHLVSSIDKLNFEREKMLKDFVSNEKKYQKIEEENERLKHEDFKRIGVSPEYYQELESDNKKLCDRMVEMDLENKRIEQKYENLKMILTGFVEKYGRLK